MLRIVALISSAVAGACWLAGLFLPWTGEGTLANGSLLDAVELVRRGTVDAVVPSYAALALLTPALSGIVAIGVVGLVGRASAVLRLGALVVGAVAVVLLVQRLSGMAPSNYGAGSVVGLLGVAAALLSIVLTGPAGLLRLPAAPPVRH